MQTNNGLALPIQLAGLDAARDIESVLHLLKSPSFLLRHYRIGIREEELKGESFEPI
jgi:hypothetical protein